MAIAQQYVRVESRCAQALRLLALWLGTPSCVVSQICSDPVAVGVSFLSSIFPFQVPGGLTTVYHTTIKGVRERPYEYQWYYRVAPRRVSVEFWSFLAKFWLFLWHNLVCVIGARCLRWTLVLLIELGTFWRSVHSISGGITKKNLENRAWIFILSLVVPIKFEFDFLYWAWSFRSSFWDNLVEFGLSDREWSFLIEFGLCDRIWCFWSSSTFLTDPQLMI